MVKKKPFGYIYLIRNYTNFKVYVGKTESTIKKRWYTHKWRANHIDRVQNPIVIDLAIAKYGARCFKIEKIDEAYTKEDLFRAEAYWIRNYDATNPNMGYNINLMGDINFSEDYESIWEIKRESQTKKKKKEKWKKSLIKKRIATDREEEFKNDLKNLSGVQLEKKYGLENNRRALLREIRRILQNENIKTMKQAKNIIGGKIYDPKKSISPEMENEFINDFKLLSGTELERIYDMSRRVLVKCIKEIYNKRNSQLLHEANSFEDIKRSLGGILYSDPKKKIPLEREQEFKIDVKCGLKRRELCKKYEIGTTVFYKELQRLCGVNGLKDLRETIYIFPPRLKLYISKEEEQEFKKDLKKLSGSELQSKYNISDRRILLREIRRILKREDLSSMKEVKKFLGGKIYDQEELKKSISPECEKEFIHDIKRGLILEEILKKYQFGTKVFYRELERIFKTRSLKKARKR